MQWCMQFQEVHLHADYAMAKYFSNTRTYSDNNYKDSRLM